MENQWSDIAADAKDALLSKGKGLSRDRFATAARAATFAVSLWFLYGKTVVVGETVTVLQSALLIGMLYSLGQFTAIVLREREERRRLEKRLKLEEHEATLQMWRDASNPMMELVTTIESWKEHSDIYRDTVIRKMAFVNARLRALGIPCPPMNDAQWGVWHQGLLLTVGLSQQGDLQSLEDARRIWPTSF